LKQKKKDIEKVIVEEVGRKERYFQRIFGELGRLEEEKRVREIE
jgi:hypothetical protein